MTIAYILKMYPRFSETFVLNEILELERQGLDLRIYSLRKPDDGRFHANLARVQAPVLYLPEYLLAEKERTFSAHHELAKKYGKRYHRVLWYALTRRNRHALKRFSQAAILAAHLQSHPVEHLHAHFASSATRVAMFVHLLTGVPYSFTAHAKDIFLNTVDPDLLRDKIRAAKFVVTVSDFNRAYLTHLASEKGDTSIRALVPSETLDIPPNRIRLLYNGVDLNHFDPEVGYVPQRAREPLILAIGRLVEKKGFHILLHACALLRDRGQSFRCDLIGKGPQESTLRALIAELEIGDRVRLLGPKSQDDVGAAYRRAAVFALPCIVGSDGNRDGLPTVLLEAMAMRVPVVSTDLTGVPEIIDDGITGRIVPQNDAVSLADALTRLLRDAQAREQMGHQARAKVEREFDLRRNVTVLREWLSGSPNAHALSPVIAGFEQTSRETHSTVVHSLTRMQ